MDPHEGLLGIAVCLQFCKQSPDLGFTAQHTHIRGRLAENHIQDVTVGLVGEGAGQSAD